MEVKLPKWNCAYQSDWNQGHPIVPVPPQLESRTYTNPIMTVGKYRYKSYDWIIRNDIQYCKWIIGMELRDQLDDSLTIFAHYCLESTNLADEYHVKQITKKAGPCNMVTTTYTGYGRRMLTGAATVNMFSASRAQEITECPKRFRGYTIDPDQLKETIKKIAAGQMSLDVLSWIWNQGNYLVTPEDKIYYFMHK